MQIYDALGTDYRQHRRPDRRLELAIRAALGDAHRIINVGAGSGSYEPADRQVAAVEPSLRMARQRPPGSAPVVLAHAESIPFVDRCFEAAMAVLTIHHWRDWQRGVRELRRVAARIVIVTWDPTHPGFWLGRDYFPDLLDHDRRIFPPIDQLVAAVGDGAVQTLPIPHDCSDGFLGAYWRRPQRYLDAGARGAISTFARLQNVAVRLARLADDLETGQWYRNNTELLGRQVADLGYRLVIGNGAMPAT